MRLFIGVHCSFISSVLQTVYFQTIISHPPRLIPLSPRFCCMLTNTTQSLTKNLLSDMRSPGGKYEMISPRKDKLNYYIDKRVSLENTPRVKFIRNYIRDPSGVFSISSLVRILMTPFPALSQSFVQTVGEKWRAIDLSI